MYFDSGDLYMSILKCDNVTMSYDGNVVFNGEISVKDARENMERLSREYNVKIEIGVDKDFPKFITEYLEENFLPYYKSYIYYLEKPYKGKLDDTNNKTEGYFRATMPKGQKRKYRTLKGLIN